MIEEVTHPTWTDVAAYIESKIIHSHPALEAALESSTAAGFPPIAVSPAQGKLLKLQAQAVGAKRICEVGTLGGYSTIWLSMALQPDGELITLEIDENRAEVARVNIARANLPAKVSVITGPASESLEQLEGPFDFFFIDADKLSNSAYFRRALQLSRKGTVIVVDNVVHGGKVLDAADQDEFVQGMRGLYDTLQELERQGKIDATAVQTVGSKGYDGFVFAVVL